MTTEWTSLADYLLDAHRKVKLLEDSGKHPDQRALNVSVKAISLVITETFFSNDDDQHEELQQILAAHVRHEP